MKGRVVKIDSNKAIIGYPDKTLQTVELNEIGFDVKPGDWIECIKEGDKNKFAKTERFSTIRRERLSRKDYVISVLVTIIIALIVGWLVSTVIGSLFGQGFSNLIQWVVFIVASIFILLESALRCHDFDKTGLLALLLLVPYLNILFLIYLLVKKGTDGPNNYGQVI